ncbi:MAG: Flp pilus assembly complex ATPase component TadA [Defluviitaleaceae bacterium]|nr:Flp pilus assembly complex ATPase component TadA [Defluviitaleaceae bacterium]
MTTPEKSQLSPLLKIAIERNATDLHICPGAAPHIKIKNALEALEHEPLTGATVRRILDEIIEAEQKRVLQEMRAIEFTFAFDGIGRFRAYVYYQRGTLAVTVRILPFSIPTLREIGFDDDDFVKIIASKSKGLIVFTGAPGAGKTTTMAAIVDFINETASRRIAAIENPIEYLHRHKKSLITQQEIGADAPDTAAALRRVQRCNPDIIVLGEFQAWEGIEVNLRLLAEERLVLTTLQSASIEEAFGKLKEARLMHTAIAVIHQNYDEATDEREFFTVELEKYREETAGAGDL